VSRLPDDLERVFTFGRGTTPPAVREAVELEAAARPRLVLPAPTRSDVDRFFGELAELVKRARGEP
jgi:hypothetical protein